MIKGRYVAQIEVDFKYDGYNAEYKTVHDRIYGEWINRSITAAVMGVFGGGNPLVAVTKQYAEVAEIKEGEG